MGKKTFRVNVFYCDGCRRMFRTPEKPLKCRRCGRPLVLVDSYKTKKVRRSRKQGWEA